MRVLLFALLTLFVVGCGKPVEPMAEPPDDEQASQQPAKSEESVGILPTAGAGLAPVTGSDSVTGSGGGGTHQAAKNMAKKVGGSSSIDDYDFD
ncbi:MAG: hypothetical protein IH944_08200 [Armatimonadetes bacterium]|nr:hypothetical protein [Armatimonadota bacterium]